MNSKANIVATIAGVVAFFMTGFASNIVDPYGENLALIGLVAVVVASFVSALVREAQGKASWL